MGGGRWGAVHWDCEVKGVGDWATRGACEGGGRPRRWAEHALEKESQERSEEALE